jgi:hypothetical protein
LVEQKSPALRGFFVAQRIGKRARRSACIDATDVPAQETSRSCGPARPHRPVAAGVSNIDAIQMHATLHRNINATKHRHIAATKHRRNDWAMYRRMSAATQRPGASLSD